MGLRAKIEKKEKKEKKKALGILGKTVPNQTPKNRNHIKLTSKSTS